jgi:hypothetical protein
MLVSNRSARRRLNAVRRAAIEPLESRLLMIISQTHNYVVSNNHDNGTGSLRAAILQSNADSGTNTITFDSTAFPANAQTTINLTTATLEANQTYGSLSIMGLGADRISVNGGGSSTVFTIDASQSTSISGLTITNGSGTKGGGIYNDGALTLNNDTIANNVVGSNGNDGTNGNPITPVISGSGGGIYTDSDGSLTINGSTLDRNAAIGGGSGGGIYGNGSAVSITNSTVADNSAGTSGVGGSGGGIDQQGG